MRSRYTLPIALACALGSGPREIRIGLLLPADGAIAREASRGAAAASALLRATGTPVRVVERRVRGPWGSEAGEVVNLVYEDGVLAIVTAPDRNSSHLAAQVTAKAHVPVIVGSGASALTRIPLPWMVRVVHGERSALAALLASVDARPVDGGLAALVDGGREGARLKEEIRRASLRSGWGEPRFGAPGAGAVAFLVAASPESGAAALRAARAGGWKGSALLLPGPGEAGELLRRAGEAAVGAILPRGEDPAAAAFDAVLLAARAAYSTDGSARRMRESMLAAPPLRGATGSIELDADGDRLGPAPVTVVRTATEEHP